ncbi:hypothetical protein BD779DRAFT_1536632 [Infundibulicybe gibba]|nr:hypothetical protein BD779DRAFT_1536632 [Infundibulicybe gibba]
MLTLLPKKRQAAIQFLTHPKSSSESLGLSVPHLWVWYQTTLFKISVNSRLILPTERSFNLISELRHQCGRISNSLGDLRLGSCSNPIPPSRLRSSNIRHNSGLPDNTHPPKSAECSLHLLERTSLGGSGADVWSYIKCWNLRSNSRHACRYIPSLWKIWPYPEMGRRFPGHSPPRHGMVGRGFHGADRFTGCSMESREASSIFFNSTLHWLRLGFHSERGLPTSRESSKDSRYPTRVAFGGQQVHSTRSGQPSRKASPCLMYFPIDPAILTLDIPFCKDICITSSKTLPNPWTTSRPIMDSFPITEHAKKCTTSPNGSDRRRLVGRREHLLWNWGSHRISLCNMDVGARLQSRAKAGIRYRMGRSCSCRAWLPHGKGARSFRRESRSSVPSTFGQRRCSDSGEQRTITQSGNKQGIEEHLPIASEKQDMLIGGIHPLSREHRRRTITRGYPNFPPRISESDTLLNFIYSAAPVRQDPILVAVMQDPSSFSPSTREAAGSNSNSGTLWVGVNTPPPSTIGHRNGASYGAGLRKFHIFCDVFSIPEARRLPADFPLLNSFALWAATDPECLGLNSYQLSVQFEPVSVGVVRKYLAAIRAWHLAQGWAPPLSEEDHNRINWTLRGLTNLQGGRKQPVRPPVTTLMLQALRRSLDISQPFDACVWAMATCAFWGMMRFGEVSVEARSKFSPDKNITREGATFGQDLDGKQYVRLDLPAAKTADPGEIQQVFLTCQRDDICAIQALRNLAVVVPAQRSDPLFSWKDDKGAVQPMVKSKALKRINDILGAWGWGTTFGHSFRIGGASFYLAQKVSPEIVRLAGRWKSLAYETYIRAFEQISSQHMGQMPIPIRPGGVEAAIQGLLGERRPHAAGMA